MNENCFSAGRKDHSCQNFFVKTRQSYNCLMATNINGLTTVKISLIYHFGAYFQGLMFGYATDETEECMPLTVVLSHQLNAKIAQLRRNGEMGWARPDSKTQVSWVLNLCG